MDQGMEGHQLFPRCFSMHGNTKAGTMEVPRILPSLSPVEEGIGMVTSFGMDHKEVFIICPMGVLDDSLEMGCPRRDGIQGSIQTGKSSVPVCEFLDTSTDKF
jgi:hypothetical protein